MTSEPSPATPVTDSELLTVVAARELANRRVVFAGHGLPTLAVSLAQHTCAPDVEIVYESGVTGAHPASLPRSISDAVLVAGAEAVLTMSQLFEYMIQGERIDVGFLGAAQIDEHGSLNSTLIGDDWRRPASRLPGSGGAIEVMAHAREVFVVMRRHTPQTLVKTLDFCTSPSPDRAAAGRGAATSGRGVTVLITELGVMRRDPDSGAFVLTSVHPGVTVDDVRSRTGWDLQVAAEVGITTMPTDQELHVLRRVLDPDRVYLR